MILATPSSVAFFDGPFESVKFDDGKKKSYLSDGFRRWELLKESKLDAMARNGFNPAEPRRRAVAQFVELACLRT